jgi:4-aminobutyrate aminotransferase-like enzyme
MDRLGHVSTLYPTLPIVDLAEKIANLSPGKLKKVFFSASGTEADETAVALAMTYTGSTELIALRHGYSGRSLLAQSLVGHAKYRVVPTQVAGVKHAQPPYCYRCPFGLKYPSCELKCAQDIEDLIQTTTTGHIAGFLAEPIMGVGGFITAPDGYFKVAVDIVRKYGGLFLCDEVQTGFGRTGNKMWGIEQHEGVEPDVMTMAKGIANGFPIAATIATAPIADSWKGGNISTFGGNPICATAASATIDAIGDVRGKGLMQAIELVKDETANDRTPAPETANRLFEETRKRGLLIGRGGLHNNVMRIAPALNCGKSEVDEALRILEQSFAALSV